MGCDGLGDGRGVAVADLNGDGLLDLVMGRNNAGPTIYVNRQARHGNWLRVDLGPAGPGGGRDPLGARVDVVVRLPGGAPRQLTRWVEAGSGYASQSEPVLHFGLGAARAVESLRVTWPGGAARTYPGRQLDPYLNATVALRGGAAPARRAPGGRTDTMTARAGVRGR